jgi:hypothetical protein
MMTLYSAPWDLVAAFLDYKDECALHRAFSTLIFHANTENKFLIYFAPLTEHATCIATSSGLLRLPILPSIAELRILRLHRRLRVSLLVDDIYDSLLAVGNMQQLRVLDLGGIRSLLCGCRTILDILDLLATLAPSLRFLRAPWRGVSALRALMFRLSLSTAPFFRANEAGVCAVWGGTEEDHILNTVLGDFTIVPKSVDCLIRSEIAMEDSEFLLDELTEQELGELERVLLRRRVFFAINATQKDQRSSFGSTRSRTSDSLASEGHLSTPYKSAV